MAGDRHGEWPSPITPELVVAASVSFGEVLTDGPDVYWSELRPEEGGRVQIVRRTEDGSRHDLLPDGFSARTRVHEYGGGAWVAAGGHVCFANWSDQRLYRVAADGSDAPDPITPEPPATAALRYADLRPLGDLLVCVRERHEPGGAVHNEVVAVDPSGTRPPQVLVSGPDFVSNPRPSPRGDRLAWIEWDHPDMPWDSTRLCVAAVEVGPDGAVVGERAVAAGGPRESVLQPVFRGDGALHLLSDRDGWWNAYSIDPDGAIVAETALEAEIGTPPWVFGMSRYGFLADGRMVLAHSSQGVDQLAVRGLDGAVTELDLPFTEIASVAVRPTSVVFVGAAFDREPAVVEVPIDGPPSEPVAGAVRVLGAARDLGLDPAWFSTGSPVSFPSGPAGERTAHALHYPPTNPEVEPPADELPPLLVLIHGGPTSMARPRLDLAKQFWTSRGFAVVDVNYGGSTGFGRPYRDLLRGEWGVVDVEDCVAAARWLAEQGLADPARLCIRGGSAGGFTVLAALAGTDVFAAGASSYGVADLRALAEETHKFESRYLDGLIGPYPQDAARYDERSPINHVADLRAPLIVFQGLEDEVVPPNQSEMIVDALRANGVPVAYLAFEGEQHGFRKAETVITVLGSELAFYGRVLGFSPSGDLPPVEIENLPPPSA